LQFPPAGSRTHGFGLIRKRFGNEPTHASCFQLLKMSVPSARLAAVGRKGGGLSKCHQPPSGATAVAPPGAAAAAAATEEEWAGSGLSHPSFACDDRALNEMRLAVGSMLESVGFTHASSTALELLTDVGVRYMRKMVTTAKRSAETDGRTRTTDADVLASYRTMRVNIDEMNEYMRQVRPNGEPRVIPSFPVPIAPTPIVYTPVSPSLIVPPPEAAFPGLPPMSTQWLRREDIEQMMGKEKEEKDLPKEEKTMGADDIKRMMSSFAGAEAVPSFLSKSATAFGLKKGDRNAEERRGVGGRMRMEEMEEREGRRKGEKRKNMESSKGRISKQFRPASGAGAATSSAAYLQQDDPCTSSSVMGGAAAAASSRPPSRTPTPAMGASLQTAGSISALRDGTRPSSSLANVPLPGALAPLDYANAYTEGAPMRIPGLLAAFGRETSESRELEKQQPRPSPLARPPSPPLAFEDLLQPPPADAPPTRVVQLAILRSLFSKDHSMEEELTNAFLSLKATPSAPAAAPVAVPVTKPPPPPRRSTPIPPPPRKSTPLPPPPPAPVVKTPRVVIKPPVKPPSSRPSTPLPPPPAAPVIATPLPPLRLKINIGPRPSTDTAPTTPAAAAPSAAGETTEQFDPATIAAFIDDDGVSTAGPSSASTIPLLFSPATAAAAAAAA
ncbi:hypothetical protein PMAYCL1PPCAC_03032, partial [Pristionchus mayeri]